MKEDILKLRMAAIAGAAHAIKFRDKNPRATANEVIKHVSDNADEIINKMDEDEEI